MSIGVKQVVNGFDYSLKTLVIGLGISGYSCVEFLSTKKCPFDVCDTRENPPKSKELKRKFPLVKLIYQDLDVEFLRAYQQIVISPGISTRLPCFDAFRKNGKLIIGDVELFAQELNARKSAGSCQTQVIAITGSNGKSTVTTMVEHMAKQAGISVLAGGNLGLPVLTMLKHSVDLYVIELSSFQLETLESLQTESAVLLNISEDHMDRYDNLDDYQRVKEKIYQNCRTKVFNFDEKYSQEIRARFADEALIHGFSMYDREPGTFGLIYETGEEYIAFYQAAVAKKILPLKELKVKGRHNVTNALAAIALLEPWNIDDKVILSAMRSYTGLPHRCEWVRELRGVSFYNDSKGTNVGATIAAINGFSETIILIAGGMGKGADFAPLASIICEKITLVVLFGRDAGIIADAIIEDQQYRAEQPRIIQRDTLKAALQVAFENAGIAMSILFSPACSSFDQYQSYVLRGEDFVKQVNALS